LKLQLRRHVGEASSAQDREENSAALSVSALMIGVACKRNAAIRNIAFGLDEVRVSRRTFQLVKSKKVGKMQFREGVTFLPTDNDAGRISGNSYHQGGDTDEPLRNCGVR
jgi:hypothetical protein